MRRHASLQCLKSSLGPLTVCCSGSRLRLSECTPPLQEHDLSSFWTLGEILLPGGAMVYSQNLQKTAKHLHHSTFLIQVRTITISFELKSAKNHVKMHKKAPSCTDTCNTPLLACTQVETSGSKSRHLGKGR